MHDLLHSALASQARPDAAMIAQLRRQMRTKQARHPGALPLLAALAGTAMTAALVFALTVLFPNPPWKQIVQIMGGVLCVSTWLLAIFSAKLVLVHQERKAL
jgi:formate/nitrite transporter FocA (FNT family)